MVFIKENEARTTSVSFLLDVDGLSRGMETVISLFAWICAMITISDIKNLQQQ